MNFTGFLAAEQTFLDIGVRQGCGCDCYQRLVGAITQAMHVARECAPAGAGLSAEQHG